MKSNPVYRVCTKILFAPIILYGLYVQFHGDFGPGGGFQAGVIIAAAFILYGIVNSLEEVMQVAPPKIVTFMTVVGVALYGGVGVANLALGGNYLDYNTLSHDVAHGQHIGIILVELGVGITVTSVMLNLFYLFAGYKGVAREMTLDMLLMKWNYLIVVILMMIGLYIVMSRQNLVKKLVGLSIFPDVTFPALYLDRQGC